MKRKSMDNVTLAIINNKAMVVLCFLLVTATISSGGLFVRWSNISSVMRQIAVSGIVGAGFTAVMCGGGIDLSVGHILSLSGIVYGMLALHVPIWVAMLACIATGIFCGLLNGIVSERFGLPAFIVTLATGQIFKGISLLLTNAKTITGLPESVKFFGQGLLFDTIPVSMLIMFTVAGVMAVIIHKTKLGRHIVASGGNAEAAIVSGINVKKTRIVVYAMVGLCASIAAIVQTGRVWLASCGAGDGIEMDIIAAVVIGGTSMAGGKAKLGGTIVGCLIMGIIGNMMNLSGIDSFWQSIVKGLIIIFAILIDTKTNVLLDMIRKRHERKAAEEQLVAKR